MVLLSICLYLLINIVDDEDIIIVMLPLLILLLRLNASGVQSYAYEINN